MNRSKVDPKKEEQDRLQNILLDLLKEEENKYCADCNAKTPRWAAWNLGVFICIRCAGIHRNLGVHISKVRSVNLDSWTAEQVQSMRVMGNEKARKVYEHSLPEHFRRGMSDHQMEQFIRAKYDQKRYMLKDFVYPRVDGSEIPKPGQATTKKTPVAVIRPPNGATNQATPVKAAAPALNVDLLDFSCPTAPAEPQNTGHNNGASLLDGLNDLSINETVAPVQAEAAGNDFDDMFGSFVSATPSCNATNGAAPVSGGDLFADAPATTSASDDLNGFNFAATPAAPPVNDEKKSNADILSLFGSSPAPSAQVVAPGGFAAFGMHAAPIPQQKVAQPNQFAAFETNGGQPSNGASSLMGLNFGGSPMSTMSPASNNSMGYNGNASNGFPNPFGNNSMPGAGFNSPATPAVNVQSPSSPSYPVPNKTNAFADLSLGKVMNTMNMGSKPKTMEHKPVAVAPVNSSANNMNFDDLLGL